MDIVYESVAWGHIIVTMDGGSGRQPRGILGAKAELEALGAKVMRPDEASDYIRERIKVRDSHVASNCNPTETPEPEWLGKD